MNIMQKTGDWGMSADDMVWASKLVRSLEEFRKVNQDVTANQILTFLHIATKDGASQRDLEKETGLDNGTISRICAILSERGLKGRAAEPMDMIRIVMSPNDYRARVQTLSAKGRRVFNSLRDIMKGR